jgi:cold shock CspA family protein
MQKNPYLIAVFFTLLLSYPVFYLSSNLSVTGANVEPLETSNALHACIALLSFLSAVLARPVTRSAKTKPKKKSGNAKRQRSSASDRSPKQSGAARECGNVKWFNATKGFGFITRDSGEDVFVHFRSIRGEGHRSLRDGARVEYSVSDGDKGPQADDVVAVD